MNVNQDKNLKILYIEDEENERKQFCSILYNFFEEKNILIAEDGKKALDIYKTNKEDIKLIISDLGLPLLSGDDFIKYVRQIDKNLNVDIVILSGNKERFEQILTLGINGYLSKPINGNTLLFLLNKFINKINKEKYLKEKENFLNQIYNIMNKFFIISKTDLKGKITFVNKKFEEISEYKENELLGKPHNIVRHPSVPKNIFKDLWNTIQNKKIWSGEIKNLSKHKNSYYTSSIVAPILDLNGNIKEYFSIRHDITKITDDNKLLTDFIEKEKEQKFLFMNIKINNFYDVSNFFSISIMENLELCFEKKITKILSKTEILKFFNLKNGYFVLIFKYNEEKELKDILEYLLTKKEDILEIDIKLKDLSISLNNLISIRYGNKNVYENTKIGIKKLKNSNDNFIIAENLINKEKEELNNTMNIINIIKERLLNDNIISLFQPIYNNKTKNIEKYESLVRIKLPSGELLSPFFFLDIAKKSGYYIKISQKILKNSFEMLNNNNFKISINLSFEDIDNKEIQKDIFYFLDKYKDKSHLIIFEILESDKFDSKEDLENINKFFKKIKEYSCDIAIDDFGSGYSNFKRILNFQPNIVKIDGSLISSINEKKSLSIIKAIIVLCKEENITTIAEFVENKEIFDKVCKLDIDYSQGYFIGKPEVICNKTPHNKG